MCMYIFIDLNIYLSVYLYVCLPVYLSVISFVLQNASLRSIDQLLLRILENGGGSKKTIRVAIRSDRHVSAMAS